MPADLLQTVIAAQRGMQVLRALRDQNGRAGNQILASAGRMAADRVDKDSGQFFDRDMRGERPRFSRHRTHKASNAESILKHVLRQRGWTAQYNRDELTGRQHLNLLNDVRQYGRMWLRHEAESFFDRYGVEVERGLASRAAGALGRLYDRARGFIRELMVAGAMVLKGPEPLTNAEIYALDRLTQKQVGYLDKFEREVANNPPREIADLVSDVIIVEPPPMTEGQFVARLEMYGNSAWGAGNQINRGRVSQVPNAKLERRVMGMAHHCEDCPPLAAQGWVPIGTLPDIGETECQSQCKCHFEYQDSKGKTFLTPQDYELQTPIKRLPGTSGPKEKRPKGVGPPDEGGPPKRLPRPLPTVEQLLKETGSPYSADEYEEA